MLDTLAAAYAECGEFEQAVQWQTKVLDLMDEGEHDEGRDRAAVRLELYRSKRHYRE